ncbi:hypothetical protein LTR94_036737, partial [Friedmanniomyces endolithicus]
EGDPARTRQRGRGWRRRRDRRADAEDRDAEAQQGSADQGDVGAEEAQDDGADECRGDRRAQLSRRPAGPALGQEVEAEEGYRGRAGRARPRPLRAGK